MKKTIEKKKLVNYINKNKDKKIVLCHGVFDLVHYGHIKHFKSAKKFGDILIVSITKDRFIKKGFNRPLFNEIKRSEYLSEIDLIDYVYICETESAADSIKIIKPKYYVKGPDYKNNKSDVTKKIYLEKKLVEKYKGKIVYTKDEKFSSSTIINNGNLLNYNTSQKNFIEKIKRKYGYDYIKKEIKKFNKIKVLLVGELIFDQYCFGNIIGKSGKEPHLVLKEETSEYYVGGIGAVARHLSSFVNSVHMMSPFGNEKFLKKILKKNLKVNIIKDFVTPNKKYNSIIKKRFIDKVSNYKMFGSYILPDQPHKNFFLKLISKIKSKINKNDMLIICDYGHNFLDKKIAAYISKTNKFKALNSQLNSSNTSYHSLQNYKNMDIVIINESELRLELREEKLDIKLLASNLIKRNKIKNLIVTQGKNGVTFFRNNSSPIYCPAFVEKSIDKIGAGDAMLSIVSLAIKQNLDPEIVLFLGSIASAYSVNTIGNELAVDFSEMDRFLKFSLE
jgi:rfaE bifunctional protein kinase chain/domain/rfaE bifunctional protein nucleotidyltransferase chain/domain